MSIVVAVAKQDKAILACDSAMSESGMLVPADFYANHNKIVRCGESHLGLVGWSCTQDIVESLVREYQDKMRFTDRAAIFDSMRFLHGKLKEDYYIETNEDKDEQPVESSQIDALIVNAHGLFEVESYRTVTQYTRFWAIGSGKKLALGAMLALYDRLDSAHEIAEAAIEAACALDDSCALPAHMVEIELASA